MIHIGKKRQVSYMAYSFFFNKGVFLIKCSGEDILDEKDMNSMNHAHMCNSISSFRSMAIFKIKPKYTNLFIYFFL